MADCGGRPIDAIARSYAFAYTDKELAGQHFHARVRGRCRRGFREFRGTFGVQAALIAEFDIASGRRADVAGALAAIQALTHAHLAPVLIAVAFDDVAHIVIPWMRLMSLEEPLAAAPVGIARGMQYLHLQGVAHLLLTSKCIFVRAGGVAHGDSVWVAEYGFSTLAPMCSPGEQRYEHLVRDGIMYLAPERFVQSNWVRELVDDDSGSDPSIPDKQKADVYSFGVLLAAMANRSEPPVTTKTLASAMRKLITKNQRPEVLQPSSITDLVQRCWALSPGSRPSFDDIVSEMTGRPQAFLV